MAEIVSARELNDRRGRYFMDHQIGLHSTLVSIALGVAGLAAGSLLVANSTDRRDFPLFWVLWLISLLGVGTVYSGVTVSVYALPNRIPHVLDLFPPFAIGLMEFMLFAVLASPLTKLTSPRVVITVWFACFSLFSTFASLAIRRAIWLFQHTSYEKTLQKAIDDHVALVFSDFRGATGSAVLGISAAATLGSNHAVPLTTAYIFALIAVAGLIRGLFNQRRSGRELESKLIMPSGSAVGDAAKRRRRHSHACRSASFAVFAVIIIRIILRRDPG